MIRSLFPVLLFPSPQLLALLTLPLTRSLPVPFSPLSSPPRLSGHGPGNVFFEGCTWTPFDPVASTQRIFHDLGSCFRGVASVNARSIKEAILFITIPYCVRSSNFAFSINYNRKYAIWCYFKLSASGCRERQNSE